MIEPEVEDAVDSDSVVLFVIPEKEDVSDSDAVTNVDDEADVDVESEGVIFATDNIEVVDVASETASVDPEETVSVVEPDITDTAGDVELVAMTEEVFVVGLAVRFVSAVTDPGIRVVDSTVV